MTSNSAPRLFLPPFPFRLPFRARNRAPASAHGARFHEDLLVLRSDRVANDYNTYFEYLWDGGRHFGETWVATTDEEIDRADALGKAIVVPGDIVVNEVHWYGLNSSDVDGYDQFIELRNMTDRDIRLDMWSLTNADDFVVGIPPGSIIPANGYFTIVDHVTEVYADGEPQDDPSAFVGGNLVLNAYNDNRQARLYLKGSALGLALRDPNSVIVDEAGDGGAAFFGGPIRGRATSMERNPVPGDGAARENWHSCTASEGGVNVNDEFKDEVIATPGEPNSAP